MRTNVDTTCSAADGSLRADGRAHNAFCTKKYKNTNRNQIEIRTEHAYRYMDSNRNTKLPPLLMAQLTMHSDPNIMENTKYKYKYKCRYKTYKRPLFVFIFLVLSTDTQINCCHQKINKVLNITAAATGLGKGRGREIFSQERKKKLRRWHICTILMGGPGYYFLGVLFQGQS